MIRALITPIRSSRLGHSPRRDGQGKRAVPVITIRRRSVLVARNMTSSHALQILQSRAPALHLPPSQGRPFPLRPLFIRGFPRWFSSRMTPPFRHRPLEQRRPRFPLPLLLQLLTPVMRLYRHAMTVHCWRRLHNCRHTRIRRYNRHRRRNVLPLFPLRFLRPYRQLRLAIVPKPQHTKPFRPCTERILRVFRLRKLLTGDFVGEAGAREAIVGPGSLVVPGRGGRG